MTKLLKTLDKNCQYGMLLRTNERTNIHTIQFLCQKREEVCLFKLLSQKSPGLEVKC